MKKSVVERNFAALLFVVVLITFSFAERDSKKIEKIYTTTALIKKTGVEFFAIAARNAKDDNNY